MIITAFAGMEYLMSQNSPYFLRITAQYELTYLYMIYSILQPAASVSLFWTRVYLNLFTYISRHRNIYILCLLYHFFKISI